MSLESLDDTQQNLLLRLLDSGLTRDGLVDVILSKSNDEWANKLNERRRAVADASGADKRPALGTDIVLSGGAGTKRKFDGQLARVVEYPQKGCWMTVRILGGGLGANPGIESGETVMKWRKRGFGPKPRIRSVGLLDLSDDSLVHIFGYVAHGKLRSIAPYEVENIYGIPEDNRAGLARLLYSEDIMYDCDEFDAGTRARNSNAKETGGTLSLMDAAHLFVTISLICRQLRHFVNKKLSNVLGYVDANLDALTAENLASVVPCISWMSKYQLRLGKLNAWAEVGDIAMLCEMLQNCDTENLLDIRMRVGRTGLHGCVDSAERSNYIGPAWVQQRSEGDVVYVEGHPSIGKMAADLKIPFRDTCRKELHDTIAKQCPKVTNLVLDAKVPADPSGRLYWKEKHFSHDIFSMPSIRHLQLFFSIGVERMIPSRASIQIDNSIITRYVENLKNISDLKVGADIYLGSCVTGSLLHFQSATLKRLNVKKMGKCVMVNCKCPKLEKYICHGMFPYNNGIELRREQAMELSERRGTQVVMASWVNHVALEVPPACQCVLVRMEDC